MAKMSAQDQLTSNWGGFIFLIGKIVRFFFFSLFLFSVLAASETLAGYTREQVILFFLVFNLVDITCQFLFRGVYVFRWRIVSGDFDLDLVKPLPSFFRPLFAWTDFFDFVTLFPLIGFTVWYLIAYQLTFSWLDLLLFSLLFFNSLIVGFAVHLFVSSIGVITTEVDHLVWIWRDLFNLARFPTDIYSPGLRLLLTLIFPVVIVVTVPAKALMGLSSWPIIFGSCGFGFLILVLSLKFWRYALKRYSSASS